MQFHKYCSSEEILSRVFRDTGMSSEIPIVDAIEWIYDALTELNAPMQFKNSFIGYKEDSRYDFTTWKVPIPCSAYRIRTVLVDGHPAVPSSNNTHEMLDGNCCGFNNISTEEQGWFQDNWGTEFSPLLGNASSAPTQATFTLNSNFITFDRAKGKCCLFYWEFPVSERGFPEIPDDAIYKKYITNYITSKLDYIMWRQGMITNQVYQDSEEKRMWSAGQVSAKAKIPDELQLEVMKRDLIKLVPRFSEFHTNFRNLSHDTDHL